MPFPSKSIYQKKKKSFVFGKKGFTVVEIFTKLIFSPPCFLLDNWQSS